MASVHFHSVRWKNLLSTGNEFLEITLDQNKNTLFVGENGAGKSTILDAFSLALFNKPFRDVNKPELLNSITKKDLLIEVELSTNGSRYRIVRGMKPNIFEIYRDGELVNVEASVRDYQDILEKQILRMNHKSFCQVVVLGSASFVPFMKLPAASRREVVEDILDLQVFTKMNVALRSHQQAYAENLQASMVDVRTAESMLSGMLTAQKAIAASNEEVIADKKELLTSAKHKLKSARETKAGLLSKQRELSKQLAGNELAKTERLIMNLRDLKTKVNTKLAMLTTEIKFFETNDSCPSCLQKIAEDFKTETMAVKRTKQKEYTSVIEQMGIKATDLEAERQRLAIIDSDAVSTGRSYQDVVGLENQYLDYIKDLTTEIAKLSEKSNAKVEGIEEAKIDLDRKTNIFNAIREDKEVFDTAGIILKDGGIKTRFVKQYIPVINKLLNKYLSAMDFFVNFELDEQFKETIKSRHRDEFSYGSFSEGEKFRINLAVLFTWRAVAKMRSSVSTNLLILDEVMDSSLDSNGTEEFLKIMKNTLTLDSNVIIISHKVDQIADKFEHVYRFSKHKNFTKLEKT